MIGVPPSSLGGSQSRMREDSWTLAKRIGPVGIDGGAVIKNQNNFPVLHKVLLEHIY